MEIQKYILWQDEAIVVVNKPANLRSVADGYYSDLPHLAGLLKAAFGQVWTVHRLDKDTSGIMVFALTPQAHRDLSIQFQKRQTEKHYHAISLGYPDWETQKISLPLRQNGDRSHRTVVDHLRGKPAETDIHLLRQSGGFALLQATPLTGYTHQIRAHLSSVGLPILGDPLYKSLLPETEQQRIAWTAAPNLPIQRLALHAFQLKFRHPLTNNTLTLTAPYPQDFQDTIILLFNEK